MAPRKMESSIPIDNNRIGRFRILLKELRLILLASVKSNRTRPISAINSKVFWSVSSSRKFGRNRGTKIPAMVNTIGPVMIVRSSLFEIRLYKKTKEMKIIARSMI